MQPPTMVFQHSTLELFCIIHKKPYAPLYLSTIIFQHSYLKLNIHFLSFVYADISLLYA